MRFVRETVRNQEMDILGESSRLREKIWKWTAYGDVSGRLVLTKLSTIIIIQI